MRDTQANTDNQFIDAYLKFISLYMEGVVKEKSLSEADVLALCEREEDYFFDRKAFGVDGRKVQKIAVAFANAEGGTFVIGISDDREPDIGKRWNEVPNVEAFNSHIQALNELNPTIECQITVLRSSTRKGAALQIDVEKSSQVHSTADGTIYVRMGAASQPIKDIQKVTELSFAKGAKSYEDQHVSETRAEDITESDEIKRFLLSYSPKTDAVDFVVNQNLVTRDNWVPRVAGILLFSNIPSSVMPKKCAVRISRYETKEDDPERDHLRFAETVEGPLNSLIRDSVEQVTSIMKEISIWTVTGLGRVNYPPEAIWEIIANAIIHRDYSISDDVQIRLFNNRIEVVSPGRLPGYVTVSNILDARFSRNPKIVRTLSRYKDPPNKDLGEGLNTAFQKMTERKLKPPEIKEEQNSVVVTIPHAPLASPAESILDFLQSNPTITNRQAREITGIKSENQVKTEFYKLRDRSILEMVPDKRGAASAWRLRNKQGDKS